MDSLGGHANWLLIIGAGAFGAVKDMGDHVLKAGQIGNTEFEALKLLEDVDPVDSHNLRA